MTYFAIGESTGGAGERRLGPFETPEEAAQAGRKETKDSNGAFVFRGVVDEANNQVGFDIEPIVSTNSVVRNALSANRRVVARNGYVIHQYTKGGWYLIGFSGNKNNPLIDDYAGRGEEYIFPSKESAQRFIDSTLKKLKPRGTFSIDEDRGFAFGRGPGEPNMNAVARNAEDASSILRELDGMTKRMADIKNAYIELSKKDKGLKNEMKALRGKWLGVYEASTPQEQKRIDEAHERFFNTSPFGGLF